MSPVVKGILIAVGVIFIIIGGVAFAGYRWWRANGRAYVEALRVVRDDARAFGRTAENAQCVAAGLDRYGPDSSMLGSMKGALFVTTCLPESKPTPGFCADVPGPRDFTAAREWQKRQCASVSAASRYCPTIIGPVQRFCHPTMGNDT